MLRYNLTKDTKDLYTEKIYLGSQDTQDFLLRDKHCLSLIRGDLGGRVAGKDLVFLLYLSSDSPSQQSDPGRAQIALACIVGFTTAEEKPEFTELLILPSKRHRK